MFEKIFVIFDAFKKAQAHILSVFHLFVGEVFWNQLCTNFPHAQFLNQNVMDGLVIQIQLTTNHSDCQTPIRSHENPHFGYIFVRFLYARSSRMRFIFHSLSAIQKCFMPPKNLYPRYRMLCICPFTIFIGFCCIFFKFDAKFDHDKIKK